MQNDTYFLPRVVRGTIHAAGRAIGDRPYVSIDTARQERYQAGPEDVTNTSVPGAS